MAGTATVATVGNSGNVMLEGILWGTRWDSPGATTVVSYYIGNEETVGAGRNQVYATEPYASERTAMLNAMSLFEQVANIDFRAVSSKANADLVWASISDTSDDAPLGWANPPGTASSGGEAQSIVAINYEADNPAGDAPGALVRGGFDFITFVHELGHAVGLAHTHDNGGGSTVWPGVTGPFGSLGTNNLNQGIWTMMGYNDGWVTGPGGASTAPTYGWQAGPMAFDIAALQLMYGANMTVRTGADTYQLPGGNGVGTFYSCIWDAGGVDTMAGTARADLIDLRAATLLNAPGGGGFVSYAQGIRGGFTIANGVVIENARGGAGGDVITGNAARNVLSGGDGADRLSGLDGADQLLGDAGDDVLAGGMGSDALAGGLGADDFVYAAAVQSVGVGRDVIVGFARGLDDIAVSAIDAIAGIAGNQAFALDRGGAFVAGEIRQTVVNGNLLVEFNTDADAASEMAILLQGVTTRLGAADFIL